MTLTTTEKKRLAALLRKKAARAPVKKTVKRKTIRRKTSKVALPTAAEIKAAYGKNPAPKKRTAPVSRGMPYRVEVMAGKTWKPVAWCKSENECKAIATSYSKLNGGKAPVRAVKI